MDWQSIAAIVSILSLIAGGFVWLNNNARKTEEDKFKEIAQEAKEIKEVIRCIDSKVGGLKTEMVELKGEVKTLFVKLNGRGGYFHSDRPRES